MNYYHTSYEGFANEISLLVPSRRKELSIMDRDVFAYLSEATDPERQSMYHLMMKQFTADQM